MSEARAPAGAIEILPAVKPHRVRHDGWTARKRQIFLEVLAKEASIRTAARAVELSTTSVDRLRRKDPEFDALCETALATVRPSLLETAYQRAVVGVEVPVYQGGKLVGTRRQYSDSMLRLMIDRGIEGHHSSGPGSGRTVSGQHILTKEEVLASLERKLTAIEKMQARERAAAEKARLIGWADEMQAKGWAP